MKLTKEQWLEIARDYMSGNANRADMTKKYGVSGSYLDYVVKAMRDNGIPLPRLAAWRVSRLRQGVAQSLASPDHDR